MVGATLKRWFPNYARWFKGEVTSFADGLYHIVYEDGDEEDLHAKQLNNTRLVGWRVENDFVEPTI